MVSLLLFSLFPLFLFIMGSSWWIRLCIVLIHKRLHECHNNELRCLAFIITQIFFFHFSDYHQWARQKDGDTDKWGSHPLKHSHETVYLISLKIEGVIMTSASWEGRDRLYFPLLFDEYCARTKSCTFPPVWLYHPFDLGLIGCMLASGITDTAN